MRAFKARCIRSVFGYDDIDDYQSRNVMEINLQSILVGLPVISSGATFCASSCLSTEHHLSDC